jgi:hypothetical protein
MPKFEVIRGGRVSVEEMEGVNPNFMHGSIAPVTPELFHQDPDRFKEDAERLAAENIKTQNVRLIYRVPSIEEGAA